MHIYFHLAPISEKNKEKGEFFSCFESKEINGRNIWLHNMRLASVNLAPDRTRLYVWEHLYIVTNMIYFCLSPSASRGDHCSKPGLVFQRQLRWLHVKLCPLVDRLLRDYRDQKQVSDKERKEWEWGTPPAL